MKTIALRMMAAAAIAAHAGGSGAAALIDQTTSAAPVPAPVPAASATTGTGAAAAAPSRLIIAPDLQAPGWDAPIAAQPASVSLVEAIARLLPADVPGLPVTHIDPSVAAVKVNWPAGTRREALGAAVPAGTLMRVTRSGVRVELASAGAITPASVSATPVAGAAAPRIYSVSEADATLRHAIARWSKDSGWNFRDDYWAVDKDIPVAATAVFGADFRGSVIALLTTTDLTELPIKPCFYSNQVVRVVPRAERCDRTKE